MVEGLLIFIHTLIGVFCFVQSLLTIEKYNGKVTRFDALMAIIVSCVPVGNIGVIFYNLSFNDWWNKEI